MERQGVLLSQANRLDEAANVLGDVLQRRFRSIAAAELAFVRFRQEQLDEAASLLRRAVKRDPKHFESHYYLGAVLFRQGDVKGAKRAYREADAVAPPNDSRALVGLCELQAKSGDTKGAQATQALIASRFPREAPTLSAQCQP